MQGPEQSIHHEGLPIHSTLMDTVVRIESALRPEIPTSGVIFPPLYQMGMEQGVNPELQIAQALIRQNQEFTTLRYNILFTERSRPFTQNGLDSTEQAIESYVQLLTGDAPVQAKLFAASEHFRAFIRDASREGGLGPPFQQVLDAVRNGNPKVLAFIGQNFDTLAAVNNNYAYWERFNQLFESKGGVDQSRNHNWVLDELMSTRHELCLHVVFSNINIPYERYKDQRLSPTTFSDYGTKEVQRIFSEYQTASDSLLGLVLNGRNNSALRKFATENLPILFESLFAIDRDIRYYKPSEEYGRVKRLFRNYIQGDWDFLAKYLLYSRKVYTQEKEAFDECILSGDDGRPRVFVQYAEGMHEALRELDKDAYFQPDTYIDHHAVEYNRNGMPGETLLAIAEKSKVIAGAFFSLPEHVRIRFGEHPFYNMFTDHQNYFKHTELVTQLVAVGIIPYPRMFPYLEGHPRRLSTVLSFGKSLFESTLVGAKRAENEEIHLPSGIVMQFLEGKLTRKQLMDIGENVAAIDQAMRVFIGSQNEVDLSRGPLPRELEVVYTTPLSDHAERRAVANLLNHGFLPTERLVGYLKAFGEEGMNNLLLLQRETASGRLDPDNELQKDLEYLPYIIRRPRMRGETRDYKHFREIPFIDEDVALRASDKLEAEAAAYEAATLYWFIRQGLDPNRRKVVIGNQRFGYRFYVDPLRSDLEDLGVSVNSYGEAYVHSMIPNDAHDFETVLPQSFADYLTQKDYPNVVVVDGSNDAFRGSNPRLPSAHIGYLGWFLAYNEALGIEDYISESIKYVLKGNPSYTKLVDRLKQTDIRTPYHISFWTPQRSDKIIIGGHVTEYRSPNNEGPQLVLASPIIVPSEHTDFPRELRDHTPGYFNDPERNLPQGAGLAFTRRGLQVVQNGMDEEQFTQQVQTHIAGNLPRMIRMTNPVQRL